MKLLLDTHLLLWAAGASEKLSSAARSALEDTGNDLLFSAASLWEIAIKHGLGREDFQVDIHVLRRGLLENGYEELAIAGEHTLYIPSLPPLHKDPFDRVLISQATVEGIVLMTADRLVAQYPGPIQLV